MACTCKKDNLPKHPCPIEVHVELNDKPHCNCCQNCQDQCHLDVSEDLHKG